MALPVEDRTPAPPPPPPPPPRITEAEEIRLMKQQINQARREQARGPAAPPPVQTATSQAVTQARDATDRYEAAAAKPAGPQSPEARQLETEANQAWAVAYGHVETELRTSAVDAADPATALQNKATQLKALLPTDTLEGQTLIKVVDQASLQVSGESNETRRTELAVSRVVTAMQKLQTATPSELPAAETEAQQALNNLNQTLQTEISVSAAQQMVTDAQANVDYLTGNEVPSGIRNAELPDARQSLANAQRLLREANAGTIDPTQISQQQFEAAMARVKAAHGGRLDMAVDYIGATYGIGRKLSDIRAGNVQGLTEAEQQLAENDPVTLAFLQTAGVRVDPNAQGLSEQERDLARSDPFVYGLLQLGDVRIGTTDVRTPRVTIGGNPVTLTEEQRQLFEQGNMAAFALSLMPQVRPDAKEQLLMAATGDVRLDFVKGRMDDLMGGGEKRPVDALRLLSTNLNASFSPGAREMLWQETGQPHFTQQYFADQFSHIARRPDPLSDSVEDRRAANDPRSYMDRIGTDVLQPLAEVAPPEVANVMLDAVKSNFSTEWFQSNAVSYGGVANGTEFYKGLSRLVEAKPDRAGEFADWLTDTSRDNPAGTLVFSLRGADMGYGFDSFRDTIGGGFGWRLSDAVYARAKDDENLSHFEPDMKLAIEQGKENAQEDLVGDALRDQYTAFNEDPMKVVQPYFDTFLGDPNIGQQVTVQNDTQLRNIVGRSLGLAPTNEAAALNRDYSVEWYGEGTNARKQIDLVVGWIHREGGDQPTIKALPLIYAAENAGVQEGALFEVIKGNGERVVIDGSVADDVIAMDDDHIVSPDDDVDLPWKYESVDDFQNDNQYSDEGFIWLPTGFALQDGDSDGHADVQRIEAARVTGGERFKFIADIGIGVAAIAGGVLLAIPSGGTSLVATGAVLTGIGIGWGVYRSVDELQNMSSHGQSLDWSNPQARSAYIGLIGSGLGVASLGTGAVATRLATSSMAMSRASLIGMNTDMLVTAGNQLSTAQRLGQISRFTGYGAFGLGAEQMGEQGISLAANWDQMTPEQRAQGLMYFGLGAADMGVGVWAHRHFSPRAQQQQQQQLNDQAFQTQQAMQALSLIGQGMPLPPELGAYIHLDANTVRFVPVNGDPVNIRVAPGDRIVVPGAADPDAPTPTAADLIIPGQARPEPRGPLWTPDQPPETPGFFYLANGEKRYYQPTVRQLPTRPVADPDNFWPMPRDPGKPPRDLTFIEMTAERAGEYVVRRRTYSEDSYQQFYDKATPQQREFLPAPGAFAPDEMTLMLAQVPGGLENVIGDIHAHNRSYAREIGAYLQSLTGMSGTHARILFGSIPQFCGGDAHYSNANPTPGTMRNAQMLDDQAVQEFYDLFRVNPAQAAKADLSLAGFDFSDRGNMDVVAYGREHMLEHPGLFPFIGEITGKKELVSIQMGPFAWDVNSPKFQDYLRFANETGQGVLLHYDWGNHPIDEQGHGRPQAGRSAYENFEELVGVLSRPEFRDVNIIFAHTGIGRFVRPDSTLSPFTRPDGTVVQMPEHIKKLYELFERVPNARADISWNDVSQAYADNPQLREGLISFVIDNQDRLIFGSDTVKPANSGQYSQGLNTGSPMFAEIARRNPMAAWKLLRGNYEAVMNDSYSRVADWTRQQPEMTPERIARMDAMLDILGQHRLRMEQGAWQDFQTWLNQLNGDPVGTPLPGVDPGVFPYLYESLSPAQRQHWHDHAHSQTGRGTSGGYAQESLGRRAAAVGIATGIGAATFAGGTMLGSHPGVADVFSATSATSHADSLNAAAFEGRAVMIGLRALHGESLRLEHEAIFELGHVTRQSLDLYVSRIVSARRMLKISDDKMLRISAATEQFWANYQYLRDLPIDDARGWTEQQRFHAIMAKAGEFQITLDRELGVQASSVNGLDARRPLGQAYRAATLLTYLANDAVTLAWLNSGDMDLSTPAGQSEAAFRILFGLGNAALTVREGASLANGLAGRTGDPTPTMRFLQATGLSSIAAAGVPWTLNDAMRVYTELSAGDPVTAGAAAVATVLDAAFTYYTARAAGASWGGLTGGPMPKAADAARPLVLLAGALALRELIALGEVVFGEDEQQATQQPVNTGPWEDDEDQPFSIDRDGVPGFPPLQQPGPVPQSEPAPDWLGNPR